VFGPDRTIRLCQCFFTPNEQRSSTIRADTFVRSSVGFNDGKRWCR
jgi:hypothetical protein